MNLNKHWPKIKGAPFQPFSGRLTKKTMQTEKRKEASYLDGITYKTYLEHSNRDCMQPYNLNSRIKTQLKTYNSFRQPDRLNSNKLGAHKHGASKCTDVYAHSVRHSAQKYSAEARFLFLATHLPLSICYIRAMGIAAED